MADINTIKGYIADLSPIASGMGGFGLWLSTFSQEAAYHITTQGEFGLVTFAAVYGILLGVDFAERSAGKYKEKIKLEIEEDTNYLINP